VELCFIAPAFMQLRCPIWDHRLIQVASQLKERETSPKRSSNHPAEEMSLSYNAVGLTTPGFLA